MSQDNLAFTVSSDSINREKKTSFESRKTTRNEKDVIYAVELGEKQRYVKHLEDDFEPYDHREVQHPTTIWETLLHLLKGSLGTGILAMPKAFYNAGYAVGTIGTLFIGFICTYCMHLLIRSEYELCKRRKVPSLTYPATAVEALSDGPMFLRPCAKISGHVINTFLLIYQLGTCCVYVVFIATNLKSATDSFVMNKIDVRFYMLALLIPLIFINWVRNLKYLAPFSTIANGITFASFGVILYYLFRKAPTMEEINAIGKIENFPLYFGTVLFALEAIGMIMPLENEMKNPRSFGNLCGVLNIGMVIIILLYIGMGFFGYMTYGSEVQGSITLNLPDETPAKVVQILLSLAIFVTHALQCYVAIDILWNDYLSRVIPEAAKAIMWEYVIRTGLVLITFVLAVAIPELELFISLFGAFCLAALGIAFPAIIQICAFWPTTSTSEKILMVTKNSFLILFGLLGLLIGTYTSLREIINKFE